MKMNSNDNGVMKIGVYDGCQWEEVGIEFGIVGKYSTSVSFCIYVEAAWDGI